MSIRRAEKKDRELVVSILTRAFSSDPHVNWLLEYSRNPNKIRSMMSYLFDETIRIGEVYLNEEGTAAALWNDEKLEKITFHFILRNLKFFFRNGFRTIYRALKMDYRVHKFNPKGVSYFHLYSLGVVPEAQGQGFASKLIDPVLKRMEEKKISVFLETSNETNVAIYGKKGFVMIQKIEEKGHALFIMKKESVGSS